MVTIPASEDSEMAVLGAAMTNRAWREEVLGSLAPDDFHKPFHEQVFTAMIALHNAGDAIDYRSLHFVTDLDEARLLELQCAAPLVLAPALKRVQDDSARRRLIGLGTEMIDRAAATDLPIDESVKELSRRLEDVRLPGDPFVPALDAADFVAAEDETYEWVIPGLLEQTDRVIWTAGEGVGKSELQLQLAVMVASGIHPFKRVPIKRRSVLLVDIENPERQLRRRVRAMLERAGDAYRGGLKLTEQRPAGIDLRNPRDFRWLDRHCELEKPALVVIGPLYKAFRVKGRESKSDETAAEEAAYALDRLRERHGCAISIEAHAPHGDSNDRAGLRPYGASLWMRWPEFGFGLKPVPGERIVQLKAWRGSRDRDREFPSELHVGHRWPWEAA